jgi:hypothetical protein
LLSEYYRNHHYGYTHECYIQQQQQPRKKKLIDKEVLSTVKNKNGKEILEINDESDIEGDDYNVDDDVKKETDQSNDDDVKKETDESNDQKEKKSVKGEIDI